MPPVCARILDRSEGGTQTAADALDPLVSRREACGQFVRSFAMSLLCAGAGSHFGLAYAAEQGQFDDLFDKVINAPQLIFSVLGYKEYHYFPIGFSSVENAPLRSKPSSLTISSRATNLITFFEVTGRSYYSSHYEKPTLPGGNSGITIGIGYDLGYCSPSLLLNDWGKYIDSASISALARVCGLTGMRARNVLSSVQGVIIPYTTAVQQFGQDEQPKYVGLVDNSLPNFRELPNDCRGALVSLVYNRGPSFRMPKSVHQPDRYVEMRNIYNYMKQQNFSAIPNEIIAMQRLWENDPGVAGLVTRRRASRQNFSKLALVSKRVNPRGVSRFRGTPKKVTSSANTPATERISR